MFKNISHLASILMKENSLDIANSTASTKSLIKHLSFTLGGFA